MLGAQEFIRNDGEPSIKPITYECKFSIGNVTFEGAASPQLLKGLTDAIATALNRAETNAHMVVDSDYFRRHNAIEFDTTTDNADDNDKIRNLEDELARRDEVIAALRSKNERLKSMVQLFGTY